jgi:hypothetical protein
MIYMWTLKFLNKFRGYLMIRSLDMSGVFSYEVYNVRENNYCHSRWPQVLS